MPLHILYGYETFTRGEALAELKGRLDEDGALATNTAQFDATRADPQEVISACDTVPFLSSCRLVIVEGVLAASAGAAKRKKAGAGQMPEGEAAEAGTAEDPGRWKVLAEYVPNMPETSTLVIIDGDVSSANALLKTLKPLAASVAQFLPPSHNDLPGWIMARSKRTGLKIEPAAVKALAALVGASIQDRNRKNISNIPIVASEMEKLKAFANGEVVREGDVRELVGRSMEHKGYELSDAVADRQPVKATRLLAEMLEDGANQGALLATIATKLRRMAIAREMMDKGAPRGVIAREAGIQDNFGLTRLLEQTEPLSPEAIRRMYRTLLETDRMVKTMNIPKETETVPLELAVAELSIGPRRAGRKGSDSVVETFRRNVSTGVR